MRKCRRLSQDPCRHQTDPDTAGRGPGGCAPSLPAPAEPGRRPLGYSALGAGPRRAQVPGRPACLAPGRAAHLAVPPGRSCPPAPGLGSEVPRAAARVRTRVTPRGSRPRPPALATSASAAAPRHVILRGRPPLRPAPPLARPVWSASRSAPRAPRPRALPAVGRPRPGAPPLRAKEETEAARGEATCPRPLGQVQRECTNIAAFLERRPQSRCLLYT